MDSFLGNISGYWWRGAEGAGGEEQLKILRFLSSRKVQKEWPGGREGGEMILSFKFKFRDLKCMSSKV